MNKNQTNDGGPAFPQPCDTETCPHISCQGMSLRDWFAGQALIGMLANSETANRGFTVDGKSLPVAEATFYIADAMLRARETGR